MDRREADFWGIVMRYGFPHDPYKKCKYGYIPDHVPSAFMVIRRNMVASPAFRQYWETMREINSYEESICYHEAIFTIDFASQGFRYALYIDTEDLKEYCDYPLMLYPVELVKNRRCPLFKRRSFFNIYEEFFIVSCGEATAELYEYLRNETGYDVNLIWENLLRTCNMADIKDRMQLNHILPKNGVQSGTGGKSRVALFMHIYFADQIDWCLRYAANMPSYADVYVTTNSENTKQLIEEKFADLKCAKLRGQSGGKTAAGMSARCSSAAGMWSETMTMSALRMTRKRRTCSLCSSDSLSPINALKTSWAAGTSPAT